MTAVAMVLVGAWLLMSCAPQTRYARLVRRLLVERPAVFLNGVTGGQVLMAVALLVVVGTAMWFEAGDLLGFMSLAAPEFVSWAVTFEIGTLVEVGTAVLALVASRRSVSARTTLRLAVDHVRGRRATRQRRTRRRATRPAANDDADPARLRLVA